MKESRARYSRVVAWHARSHDYLGRWAAAAAASGQSRTANLGAAHGSNSMEGRAQKMRPTRLLHSASLPLPLLHIQTQPLALLSITALAAALDASPWAPFSISWLYLLRSSWSSAPCRSCCPAGWRSWHHFTPSALPASSFWWYVQSTASWLA